MATQKFTFTDDGHKATEAFMARTYGKALVSEMKREAREREFSERWRRAASGTLYAIRVRFNNYKPAPLPDTYYEDMRAVILY